MSNTKLKKHRPADKSKIAFFSLFCLPPLLLYILFCVYPIFSSLYTSFFEWSGYDALTRDSFVGFRNYIQVITDSEFLAAIKNDFVIILGKEIIIIVLTILFAVSLTRLRFSKLETGIYRFAECAVGYNHNHYLDVCFRPELRYFKSAFARSGAVGAYSRNGLDIYPPDRGHHLCCKLVRYRTLYAYNDYRDKRNKQGTV